MRSDSLATLIHACRESRRAGVAREEAWRELVRRLQPVIAAVVVRGIWRWGGDPAGLADDLVQDTLLKLCVPQDSLLFTLTHQPEAAIVGYVKAIASNLTNDHFRAAHAIKRGGDRTAVAELDLPATHGSSRVVERQILLTEIETCLSRSDLGPTAARDRRIFTLYYRQGMGARAIAALPDIGLSEDGVESTLKRLTRLLRSQLVEARMGTAAGVASGKETGNDA